MQKARPSYAGGIAAELLTLRADNARLKPLERIVKHLRSVVQDQSRENLELRRELYRQADRKRQPSGPRARGSSHCSAGIVSSDTSAGRPSDPA